MNKIINYGFASFSTTSKKLFSLSNMCFPTVPPPSYTDLALPSDLVLPIEWDHDSMMLNEEELSATSCVEAGKVFEQWQTDQVQDLDIMEIDEQLGSNLLMDEIFGTPDVSPSGPLDEIHMVSDDDESYYAPYGEEYESASLSHPSPFDERYRATLMKLQESMRRSQETRKCLSMNTFNTDTYDRRKNVSSVLTSIEKSSREVQQYLWTAQRQV